MGFWGDSRGSGISQGLKPGSVVVLDVRAKSPDLSQKQQQMPNTGILASPE